MARENQGLQIALIILFMLTIILGVTTYIFFRQYVEADDSARKLESLVQEKTAATQNIQGENNDLKKMILGTPDAEEKKLEEITAQFNEDREKFAAGFDDADKYYRPLAVRLYDLLNKKSAELTDANDALQKLQEGYDAWKQQMTAQVKTHETAQQAAEDNLKTKAAEYDANLDQIRAGKDQLQAKLAKAEEKAEKDQSALKAELDNARAEAKKLQTLADQQGEELDNVNRPTVDVPDGEIRWVDQRDGTVWINLGRADALRRQTTFSVYPIDITNLAQGGRKAGIEVTRIRGEHLAEARITEDVISDPIMIGDKIYTPVWSPGEQVRFALVGLMDIDGDGVSDLQTVKELIEMSGGKVDYWADDKGNKGGEITIHTRYLVVDSQAREFGSGAAAGGQQSEEAKAKNKEAEAEATKYSEAIEKARRYGLKKITLGDLLQQMGWKSQTQVVHYGREANPKDFQPKPPEGIPRVSTGTVSDLFRPRRAPPGQPAPRGGAH
jgi:hypothetical protein